MSHLGKAVADCGYHSRCYRCNRTGAGKKTEYAEENVQGWHNRISRLGAYEINLLNDEMITSPRFRSIWQIEGEESRSGLLPAFTPDDFPFVKRAMKKHCKPVICIIAENSPACCAARWLRVKGKYCMISSRRAATVIAWSRILLRKVVCRRIVLTVEKNSKLRDANRSPWKVKWKKPDQFCLMLFLNDLVEPLRKYTF